MIGVAIRNNKIYGLYNQYLAALSNMELKFDGIGSGNTFNEMYDKFGQISTFYINEDVVAAAYNVEDKVHIYFDNDYKTNDTIKGKKVVYNSKPNVITDIEILVY